mgnify:FL=1
MGQLYEKNTDKALDKAALNQHQKILDIIEKNCFRICDNNFPLIRGERDNENLY